MWDSGKTTGRNKQGAKNAGTRALYASGGATVKKHAEIFMCPFGGLPVENRSLMSRDCHAKPR